MDRDRQVENVSCFGSACPEAEIGHDRFPSSLCVLPVVLAAIFLRTTCLIERLLVNYPENCLGV